MLHCLRYGVLLCCVSGVEFLDSVIFCEIGEKLRTHKGPCVVADLKSVHQRTCFETFNQILRMGVDDSASQLHLPQERCSAELRQEVADSPIGERCISSDRQIFQLLLYELCNRQVHVRPYATGVHLELLHLLEGQIREVNAIGGVDAEMFDQVRVLLLPDCRHSLYQLLYPLVIDNGLPKECNRVSPKSLAPCGHVAKLWVAEIPEDVDLSFVRKPVPGRNVAINGEGGIPGVHSTHYFLTLRSHGGA